ncbi:MAG: FHA domain-containing protein [Ilumatobacteraceae bacterium]
MRLVLAPGREVVLDEPVVLGRQPDRQDYQAVPLGDPHFSSSKNHALVVRRPSNTVEIVDLDSTNGTAVRFDGADIVLRPGQPTVVTVPCTIVCGSCVVTVCTD